MRVRVLGGLAVEGVTERDLGSRKARTLLKVLVLGRGAPVPAERLADVLWRDEPPARPLDQVGVLVSRLRGVLGADRLLRSDGGYSLDVSWLDLDELAARTAEAVEALAAERVGAARAAAHAALALARGPVLPDEEGDWVEGVRTLAAAQVQTARRVAAEGAARAGDHLGAIAAAEDALAHDAYDEATLRILMRAHVAAGRPASALTAYVRVRDRLVEDLGVSPTAETEALHDAIVLDERPPTTAVVRTPLPGRHVELAVLDAALEQAEASSRPHVVDVVGEAGIGKTSLVEHWCRGIADRAFVLVGRCDPPGRALPLQPVVDALATHVDAGEVLAPLLGGDAGEATVVAAPEAGRARLFAALVDLVRELAGGRVPVLVVDDLHLGGEATIEWLRYASRRPGRLLVVGTRRPGGHPPFEEATRLELGGLDVAAASALVGTARAADLHARSGGNPLLLTALADTEDDSLPVTVLDAVRRRVDGLGDAEATVRVAAVLGAEVDLDLLADVLQRPAVELLGHLEVAAAAGVLVERGVGFAFRHELEREALGLDLGAARRALVHRDAARVLADRAEADPLGVGVHARLGGDGALAVASFTRAAEVAMARHDVAAAEAHLVEALESGDAPRAFVTRARLRMATGRLDEAADDAARAVAGGAGAVALEVAGWVAYYRRRYDEALGYAEAALERVTDPALRVSCLALAGRVRHGAGLLPDAVEALEQASALEAPPEVRALAAVWLAQARAHQGRPSVALALVNRALADPDRIAHPFAPLHGRFIAVLALGQLGRGAEALRACDVLDTEVQRRGEVGSRMAAPAANVRAWILRWTGRGDEADELNHRAVESTDAVGVRSEAHYAGLLDLADGRLLAGDDGGAGALLDRLRSIEGWEGTMAWHQRHRWGLLGARLALRDGDADRAAELASSVESDAHRRGARRYELLAAGVRVLAGGEDADVDDVTSGLRGCAALDGAPLVEALGARGR